MKSKIYIGTGILLLCIAAFTHPNIPLNVIGASFLALGTFCLLALSSGVEYTESHYRIYTRILFWKTGSWKSIRGIRRICIRQYSYVNQYTLKPMRVDDETCKGVVEYQVYFVRKSGNYKIFSSKTLPEAQETASRLAMRYNLFVGEKALNSRSRV